MNQACVEPYIRSRTCWKDLPNEIQQQLGTSQKEYDKAILSFSVKNQVSFKGNLGLYYVLPTCLTDYTALLSYNLESCSWKLREGQGWEEILHWHFGLLHQEPHAVSLSPGRRHSQKAWCLTLPILRVHARRSYGTRQKLWLTSKLHSRRL